MIVQSVFVLILSSGTVRGGGDDGRIHGKAVV